MVDIRAAAVNFPDVLLVANEYQVSIPVPFTLGSEFAGVVTAVADDATGLVPGDHVFGSAFAGAFAEQIAMPVAALTVLPDGVDFAEAAAFGVAHTTAYHALRSVAEVEPDDWVVVLGAAGGVEAVFSVLSLRHQVAPPTINIFNQDPQCDLDYVPNVAREMKIGIAISNSFGFGGTNGTLVFRRS